MASKSSLVVEEVTRDFCSCSICHEPYNQPKVLPCLHSFCTHCLDSHIKIRAKGGVFRCPMCRKETKVPEKGASGFQDNFYLAGLTDKLVPDAHICQVCIMDENELSATSKCLDCTEYLCQECARKHCFSKMFKMHTVVTLKQLQCGDYDVEANSKKKILCQEHNEELKFYCKKCEVPICLDCKATEHDGHKCSTTYDAFNIVEPQVHGSISELQSQIPFYDKMFDTLDQDLGNLEQNENKIHDSIEQRAQKLHELIDKRKKELKQEASRQTETQRKKIEDCKEEVKLTTSVIKTTSEFAGKILAHGQKTEVLLLHNQITSRLQELKTKAPVSLPKEMKLEFKQSSDTNIQLADKDGFGKLSIILITRKQQPLYQGTPKIKDTPELILQFNTDISSPTGIAVTASSEMLITDASKSVHTYDKFGNFLHKHYGFRFAFHALPLPDGKVIVSDYLGEQLVVTSGDKIIKKIWMTKCNGLAINSRNEIAVACSDEKHIAILTQDLIMIKKIFIYETLLCSIYITG